MGEYITVAAIGVACVLIIIDIILVIRNDRKGRKDGNDKV